MVSALLGRTVEGRTGGMRIGRYTPDDHDDQSINQFMIRISWLMVTINHDNQSLLLMINPLQTSAGVLRARAWAASKQDRLASDDLFISADTDEVRHLI